MNRVPHDDFELLVREAVDRLADDDGRLWDHSAVPCWILVDEGLWWLTEPVASARQSGALWHVPPDPAMEVANTSVRWHGRMWAMVDCIESPPTVRTLLHEAFHGFWQPDVFGWVTPTDLGDDSLAMPDSRAALRVELRSWAHGLRTGDHAELSAANAVRQWRLSELSVQERGRQEYLDLWEGMAEYSARRWVGTSDEEVVELAENGPRASSWQRSFCYTTGPVLGWALDRLRPTWRTELPEAGSLSNLIDHACRPSQRPLAAVLDQFDYPSTLALETAEHRDRAREDDLVRARFASVLWLPLRGGFQFDPGEVRRWDLGTFYRTLSVRTEGVQLTATEGAVVTSDWKWIGLPAPNRPEGSAGVFIGPGWQLTLLDPLLATQISWGTAPPT